MADTSYRSAPGHAQAQHDSPAEAADIWPRDGAPPAREESYTPAELRLAARNHAMPAEALRYSITPVGLHYILTHYDIPAVEVGAWRLEVNGLVARPISLSLDELRARPTISAPVTLECAGNGRALLTSHPISQPWLSEAIGTATWTGVSLAAILSEAGIAADAIEVVFTGMDYGIEGGEEQDYARSLALDEALRDDLLLAYEMNGAPLPPQHGYPLRLIVPGWYGMAHVKWLRSITVVGAPFSGYQHATGYRMRSSVDDPGVPVTRMAPRSLLEPPGIPDFLTRARFVQAGPLTLRGRAWSGWGPITRVEVSVDGGRSWQDATLDAPLATYAWRAWSVPWEAAPGMYDVCSRAADATGRVQPMQATWNVGGYMNNAVQHMTVTVRAAGVE